jgi:hypothetical protein
MQQEIVSLLDSIFRVKYKAYCIDLGDGLVCPIYSHKNEGKVKIQQAMRAKRMGLKAGIPDLMLPIPKGDYNGLYIELKTQIGRVSKVQNKWLTYLQNQGYQAIVCRSVKDAVQAVANYMEGRV